MYWRMALRARREVLRTENLSMFLPSRPNSEGSTVTESSAARPTADQATKEQQIAVAEQVLAAQGAGAWPNCGGPVGGYKAVGCWEHTKALRSSCFREAC